MVLFNGATPTVKTILGIHNADSIYACDCKVNVSHLTRELTDAHYTDCSQSVPSRPTGGGESGTARINTELKQNITAISSSLRCSSSRDCPHPFFPGWRAGEIMRWLDHLAGTTFPLFSEKHISAWFTLVLLEELFWCVTAKRWEDRQSEVYIFSASPSPWRFYRNQPEGI